MNEIFLLYIWTRLGSVNGMLWVVFIATIIVALSGLVVWWFNAGIYDETGEKGKEVAKRATPYLALIAALVVVIPTQKDVAIIAGGWLVKQAASSEFAQEIGAKTYSVIMGKLDAELESMKPKK